ncbi:site-specific integrase, partial [Georgenia sp. 10Sc9-8]|nr:site-specific integrase [Georgenia halotolerans]
MSTAVVAADLDRRLAEYLAHLSIERGVSEHTASAYRRDLSRYAAYLTAAGRAGLGEVTESDVAGYVEVLRTGSDGGRPLAP